MPIKNIITGQPKAYQRYKYAQAMRRQMTPVEAKLWQRLRAGRLGGFHFRRQQVIGQFIVDFYCHSVDLVVEVDGGVHLAQKEYDQARDQFLQSRGLAVIRFTNREVNQNMDSVLGAILGVCLQRKTTLGEVSSVP